MSQLERKRLGLIPGGATVDEAQHKESVRKVHEAYQFLTKKYRGRKKEREEDQGADSNGWKFLGLVWDISVYCARN